MRSEKPGPFHEAEMNPQFGPGPRVSTVQAEATPGPLTPEFYELIHDIDPGAENDDYYVTSAEFTRMHAGIRAYLVQRLLWWSASACVAMIGLAFFYT